MHSPLSTQALAHLRDKSGPSPVRTMSRMPAIVARGSAPATPAGSLMGQASKHLPHVVQASTIASTQAVRAVSKVLLIGDPTIGLTLLRQKITAVSLRPRPEEPTQVGSTDLGGRLEGRCGPPGLHGSRRAAKSSAPH